MNDIQPPQSRTTQAHIVYYLYLASCVFGITAFIGVVMAYMNRDDADQPWMYSHYQFQIRTFWLGLLYSVISTILVFAVIGYLLFFVLLVWFVVRCIKGLKALERRQPVHDYGRWGF